MTSRAFSSVRLARIHAASAAYEPAVNPRLRKKVLTLARFRCGRTHRGSRLELVTEPQNEGYSKETSLLVTERSLRCDRATFSDQIPRDYPNHSVS